MNRASLNVLVQLSTVFPRLSVNIPKRWAGHAKWQNIKSTKEAVDRQKSINFQRIRRKILVAIKDGGDNPQNVKLKAALEEGKKCMMPKEMIQNILKNAINKETTEPYWLFYSGFGGVLLGFEVITPNPVVAIASLNSYLKKLRFKHEKQVNDLINTKGLIISEPLENTQNCYEKAVEDAIEAGISEVTQDDNNLIHFECDPEFVQGSSKKLAALGYNLQSATVEVEFFNYVKVSDEDKKRFEETIKKLQNNFHDVIRIVKNFKEEEQEANV